MPNYLTKEEIKQWRSSLEKITLEEFAARLGKEVEESKPTNDVVDIFMSRGTSSNTGKISDGFSQIAERAFERERQISHTPFSINNNLKEDGSEKTKSVINDKIEKALSKDNAKKSVIDKIKENKAIKKDAQIVLKKSLTDREQMVFEYFLNHVGETVYAKDLAALLDLPRDYIYKYIKNLRAKIDGDNLKNVPSGGFILTE